MSIHPKHQANFLISIKVLTSLKKHVPPRQQSAFVEQAIERALKRDQFLQALQSSAGAWKNQKHPPTKKFITSLRASKRI